MSDEKKPSYLPTFLDRLPPYAGWAASRIRPHFVFDTERRPSAEEVAEYKAALYGDARPTAEDVKPSRLDESFPNPFLGDYSEWSSFGALLASYRRQDHSEYMKQVQAEFAPPENAFFKELFVNDKKPIECSESAEALLAAHRAARKAAYAERKLSPGDVIVIDPDALQVELETTHTPIQAGTLVGPFRLPNGSTVQGVACGPPDVQGMLTMHVTSRSCDAPSVAPIESVLRPVAWSEQDEGDRRVADLVALARRASPAARAELAEALGLDDVHAGPWVHSGCPRDWVTVRTRRGTWDGGVVLNAFTYGVELRRDGKRLFTVEVKGARRFDVMQGVSSHPCHLPTVHAAQSVLGRRPADVVNYKGEDKAHLLGCRFSPSFDGPPALQLFVEGGPSALINLTTGEARGAEKLPGYVAAGGEHPEGARFGNGGGRPAGGQPGKSTRFSAMALAAMADLGDGKTPGGVPAEGAVPADLAEWQARIREEVSNYARDGSSYGKMFVVDSLSGAQNNTVHPERYVFTGWGNEALSVAWQEEQKRCAMEVAKAQAAPVYTVTDGSGVHAILPPGSAITVDAESGPVTLTPVADKFQAAVDAALGKDDRAPLYCFPDSFDHKRAELTALGFRVGEPTGLDKVSHVAMPAGWRHETNQFGVKFFDASNTERVLMRCAGNGLEDVVTVYKV